MDPAKKKQTCPNKTYNPEAYTVENQTLQPSTLSNPGALEPSNPETFKATISKKFKPRKNSKTGILEPLNSEKYGFRNLFGM